ncbi:sn-glycerol-3-phosphate ABC transporter substrate-binding protein UgpB [Azospirillum doebereinerae]|uniref:sn-glycerol-3-phosphate-binding periplasmic protein UgpB n=1 Tax=Azospirillum doebereinerae TaxID=92933 RepID=A0A433JFN0_9PROT|nr:sn-glycerol-3-phosphate ABC transporter substrate-binding protein UgpB [Azospirillum doebereinerae]MCG5240994.1 sn-glycerol-3-phosphate ABC transporter substrate-binding protein UgpB [Azospirillum doebereinerae]RUQ75983.1 sn-glycerol-3-phosphate ABC transporter substrate-binding protein UgpB [Azospirillum doebereinerae]
MLTRRTLGLSTAAFALAAGLSGMAPTMAQAQQKTVVEFWHGLPQPLGGQLEEVVKGFNASQDKVQVNASFKGSYPEAMQAAIAAFRAGNAPHIVQMFEVGTATMMAAGPAIKPVYQLMQETGATVDPKAYIPAVSGYYSSKDGKMMALPFNSSTNIMFYNKDAFQKAGLDPNKPPATWPELIAAAKALKASGASCPFTTSWPTWAQFEQLGAIHDTPFASQANGFGGLNAELKVNAPLYVKHVQTLVDMQKEGTFRYGGRDNKPDGLFPSGECAIIHASSGLRSRIAKEATFAWGAAPLPYWPDQIKGEPKNGIIGGAAFWVMTSPKRTPAEYKAVSEFFTYLAKPEVDAKWHMDTGYVPVTFKGFELAKAEGFYEKNPGADVPAAQLTRTPTTENTMGLRLGNLPEIRNIIQEELEKAFQGQQPVQQALDTAVQRGNVVLRNFERANKN